MTTQRIKFYQTGTYTAGNRLLDEEARTVQSRMDRTNSLNSGHRACQGCGLCAEECPCGAIDMVKEVK